MHVDEMKITHCTLSTASCVKYFNTPGSNFYSSGSGCVFIALMHFIDQVTCEGIQYRMLTK